MAFKLPKRSSFKQKGKEGEYGSTPIMRMDLDEGILGEANDDGSIYISKNIEPGSKEERSVLMHEMKHITDMKLGKLGYTDDEVTWNGDTYPRKDGYIKFEGRWYQEGDKAFPWEQH